AYQAGAKGIRANSKADILAIKKEVDLPVLGIVKRNYDNSDVFITATSREVDELSDSGCEVIAMDATANPRPQETLEELVNYLRKNATQLEWIADISTAEEAKRAEKISFDYNGTTLHGNIKYTIDKISYDTDFSFLRNVIN